ncbi:hypothetical protein [Salinimicrobium oceani]|uniref:Uncharacterized protein n=1 Tax=Salinimicrobium oceani TaxID=2722702 RepID=A0ABX1CZ78_9FLAO|nr:hypothetical protein [Salinimicrobium oceani]NJW52427.1 hypothetical protein [Salinimicrobium oceani]
MLCLPISKSVGLLWLVTGSIFLTYGISWWSAYKFSWLLAFVAVTVSQVLVTRNWRDAKAATIPNLVILAVAVASVPSEIPFKNGIFQYL